MTIPDFQSTEIIKRKRGLPHAILLRASQFLSSGFLVGERRMTDESELIRASTSAEWANILSAADILEALA